MEARLLSVNVGMPVTEEYRGETVLTGFRKRPVAGSVALRRTNLEGDRQADLQFHGGRDKAVYLYPARHYRWWEQQLGRALSFGAFGENLTVDGLDETAVRIGDILRIGSATLQVSEPRIPCFKLAMAMQAGEDFSARFLHSGRCGFYLRVIEEGEIAAGEGIARLRTDADAPTVLAFIAATQWPGRTASALRRIARAPDISEAWRARIATMKATALRAANGVAAMVPLRVSRIVDETAETRSVYLARANGGAAPMHLPGQFLPVTLRSQDGRAIHRSYSISSAPGASELRLTVKLQRGPDGSPGAASALMHHLAPGDMIEAGAPAGTFHPDPEDGSPLYLFAAGIGITPLMSVLLDALPRGRTVSLAHVVRHSSDRPFADVLESLACAYPVTFRLVLAQTQSLPQKLPAYTLPQMGRIGPDTLGPIVGDAQVLACGPADFVDELRRGLQARGVPEWRILTETFRSPASAKADDSAYGSASVRFAELEAPVRPAPVGQTLLEISEAAGLAPTFGCRAGSCGQCVTRLVRGDVRYVEPVARPLDNRIHLCVAVPVGDVELGPLSACGDDAPSASDAPIWTEDDLDDFFDRVP